MLRLAAGSAPFAAAGGAPFAARVVAAAAAARAAQGRQDGVVPLVRRDAQANAGGPGLDVGPGAGSPHDKRVRGGLGGGQRGRR